MIPREIVDRGRQSTTRGWAAVVERVKTIAAEKLGQGLNRTTGIEWLAEMNAALRDVSFGERDFARGWELRYWTSETDAMGAFLDPIDAAMRSRVLTVVAVDPRGIAHGLLDLAAADTALK